MCERFQLILGPGAQKNPTVAVFQFFYAVLVTLEFIRILQIMKKENIPPWISNESIRTRLHHCNLREMKAHECECAFVCYQTTAALTLQIDSDSWWKTVDE